MDALKTLFKQPYWIIAMLLGALLVAAPCVTIDEHNHWMTHPPNTLWLAMAGTALLLLSAVSFAFTLWTKHLMAVNAGAGVDLSRVKEGDGAMWTTVNRCEIRVVEGRVQDFAAGPGTTVVLPCNEYLTITVSETRGARSAPTPTKPSMVTLARSFR
jgi:hypothetical protein